MPLEDDSMPLEASDRRRSHTRANVEAGPGERRRVSLFTLS